MAKLSKQAQSKIRKQKAQRNSWAQLVDKTGGVVQAVQHLYGINLKEVTDDGEKQNGPEH